jgi:hypothetical protein
MALFRRKPKLQDEALSELALMFLSLPDDPTPGSELLDASQLDFSIESLARVDEHLEAMRQRQFEDEALTKFVLRCGAYLGEVIRRQAASKQWHWLDYKEAARLSPDIASFGESLDGAAILWDGKDEFCFPLAKVIKYLENGSEDSVKFFAEVMVSKSNKGE